MAFYTLTQNKDDGSVTLQAVVRPEDNPNDLNYLDGGKIFKICNKGILWRYPNVNPALGLTLENNENGDGYVAFTA